MRLLRCVKWFLQSPAHWENDLGALCLHLWQSVPSPMGHFLWSAPEEGKSQCTSWIVADHQAVLLEWVHRVLEPLQRHSELFIVTPCMSEAVRPCSLVCFILLAQNRRACLLSLTSAWKMTSEISGVYYNNTSFCSKTTLGEMVGQADDLLNKTSAQTVPFSSGDHYM